MIDIATVYIVSLLVKTVISASHVKLFCIKIVSLGCDAI
jgi:hypothetical protein